MHSHLADTESEAAGASAAMPGGIVAELAAAGFEGGVEVGRGGFGTVYRCRQVTLQRVVAVKVLKVRFDDERARFGREQLAMARLTGHPSIVPVLHVGEIASGYPFLVMPYCGQGSIQQRIGRLGALPVAEVLRLGVKMAAALACAHAVDIVHRDVKPANILYTDYGEPALGDFGIARVVGGFQTEAGVFSGSPAYAAPEILAGEPPTAASDVYGLGATLFAGLTGHAARERRAEEKRTAQLMRTIAQPMPDLREHGITEAVAAVVRQAMAHDPADRPTAVALGELIQRTQSQLGQPVDHMALPSGQESDRRATISAASTSVGGGGGRLPAQVARFVGRAAEISQLRELLSASRLLTLVGMGGVGKTALAVQTATQLRPLYSDGVWWVELAELRQGALLTEVVAAALGVRDQMGRALADVLVEFLAPRQALVVLDNCEHLSGEVAELCGLLLRDCPRLQVLATSREVLDVEGEAVFRLDPLSCPSIEDDPTAHNLAGYEAVQLFVERARAAVPGFEVNADNAIAISRCCARVDGLPLAIELAAARMRTMSADQIAEKLCDRFALLARGRRGTVTRRQSLAACVDWSYDLCTGSEQQLWCRLSVLAEGFDLPTAHGICGEDMQAFEFLDLLCVLVDKSILIRTEQRGMVSFRLLETLRDYGKGRISEAERLRLARRHAGWYHQLLDEAEAQWFGSHQLEYVQRLTRELPNIREALQFSLTDRPAMAVDMIAALRQFWVHHALLSEGCQWANRAVAAISPEPGVRRIRALFTAAHLTFRRGDPLTAMRWIAEARSVLEVVDDPVTRGRIDFYTGYSALLAGDLEGARDGMQRAMAATDDFEAQVLSMSAMSWLDLISGDASGALAWAEKCLARAESRGDWAIRAIALGSVGAAHWRLGDLPRAEDVVQDGLQLALEVSDKYAVANGLELLAWIAESSNQPRQAAVLMAAAAEISRASGAPLASCVLGEFHTECERRAREQLGAQGFQNAWNEGAALRMSGVAEAIRRRC